MEEVEDVLSHSSCIHWPGNAPFYTRFSWIAGWNWMKRIHLGRFSDGIGAVVSSHLIFFFSQTRFSCCCCSIKPIGVRRGRGQGGGGGGAYHNLNAGLPGMWECGKKPTTGHFQRFDSI